MSEGEKTNPEVNRSILLFLLLGAVKPQAWTIGKVMFLFSSCRIKESENKTGNWEKKHSFSFGHAQLTSSTSIIIRNREIRWLIDS